MAKHRRPAKLDLSCYRGDTFTRTFVFKDGGEPIAYSNGETPRMQIRERDVDENPVADWIGAYWTNDLPNGEFVLVVPAAETALLDKRSYVYDMQITDDDGVVTTWIYGDFTATGDRTR